MINPEYSGIIWDDSLDTEMIAGGDEQELTRLIARMPKFPWVYTGFNQGNTERFWYSCVIASHLRAWFSLWNPKEDFTKIMYGLCDHLEAKWVWHPKKWWYVSAIGSEFVAYMNTRFPDRKVWNTRIKYGSSVMSGCLQRNIPVITGYWTGTEYSRARSDGEISASESETLKKWQYGHCISMSWIWPIWTYFNMQDNYEGRVGNQYKIFNFRSLLKTVWQSQCFFILLPENIQPVAIKNRSKMINV